jgi:pyruvate dehydrogenase (quinone)
MVFLSNPEYGCDLTLINFPISREPAVELDLSMTHSMQRRAGPRSAPSWAEAVMDPNEPPMPAKVTARQTAHFIESLAKGTSDRQKIIETILRGQSWGTGLDNPETKCRLARSN